MGDLQKEFPGLTKCDNHSVIRVGNQDIKILYTPGHTLESACFLMDKFIFTGDTLFLGEVGRVDLSQSDDSTSLSKILWNSLQELKKLPKDILVLPGHGAGSSCGKSIQKGDSDLLGNQLLNNIYLSMDQEEFVNEVTNGLPEAP